MVGGAARLLAFVLPLGLDSFAVAAAIGAAGVAAGWRARLRISLIFMIFEAGMPRLGGAKGLTAIALGLSISLDELAIGFSLGLVRLPVVPVIVAIAVLALVVSQLGLALGHVVSERFREHAEQIAGIALIALGVYLIAQRAVG
jgi:putative Mn2+ efflux pump MntP